MRDRQLGRLWLRRGRYGKMGIAAPMAGAIRSEGPSHWHPVSRRRMLVHVADDGSLREVRQRILLLVSLK